MAPRLLVPLLLCVGMVVVPLVALSAGATPQAAGTVRVAAGAPGVAAPSPDGPPAPDAAASAPAQVTPTTVAVADLTAVVAPATTRASVAHVAAVSRPLARRTTATAATTPPTTDPPAPTAPSSSGRSETGQASWYGAPAGTCAHQTLPFGTVVRLWDKETGKTATCTVEDRGPYQDNRIIDLAPDVFSRLAPTSDGVIEVQIAW
ncbi:MAG: septal ring lytic transglycosylase RlpA family protein [Acidimicrobiales bacterium]